jgi:hypothetical protein
MRNVRVPIYGTPAQSAVIDPNATVGAVVGKDLRWADGSLVKESQLRDSSAAGSSVEIDTTDALDEGGYNLYFTAPRALSAVGEALVDSESITFNFDSDAGTITADLSDTGVDAGDYGAPGPSLVAFQVDAKGRLIEASAVPLVPGAGISFATDPDTGALIISLTGLSTYILTESGDHVLSEDGSLIILE